MKPFLNSLRTPIDRNRRLNVIAMVILLFKKVFPDPVTTFNFARCTDVPFRPDCGPKEDF